jgi:aminoglycoside phosphotransferase (APT) family kinase protein
VTPSAPEIIRDQLRDYLRGNLGSDDLEVIELEGIPEGHSGFTYFVTTDDRGNLERYVMRVPPPGARITGPADIPRQGRIMAALHEQGVPTPSIVLNCTDPVLDGRPFVLMERVDGERIEGFVQQVPPLEIAREAIAVLRRMQEVPVDKTGIGDEKPVSLDEEMLRWNWLMSRAPEELTTAAPTLGARLVERKPPEPAPTMVHADYHYGNMLFRKREDGTAELAGLLDWEIAEIGAPMLDLGCLCIVAQRNDTDPEAPNPGGAMDISIETVIEMYGADAEESRWYLAISAYKYASIFGYNLMLHRRGKRPDPMYEKLTGVITGLIDHGIRLLE